MKKSAILRTLFALIIIVFFSAYTIFNVATALSPLKAETENIVINEEASEITSEEIEEENNEENNEENKDQQFSNKKLFAFLIILAGIGMYLQTLRIVRKVSKKP